MRPNHIELYVLVTMVTGAVVINGCIIGAIILGNSAIRTEKG